MRFERLALSATSPYERGSEVGAALGEKIRDTLADYTRLFDATGVDSRGLSSFGAATLDRTSRWWPELLTEWQGIADGAGLPVEAIGVLNARTEILASVQAIGEGECTVAVQVPADGPPRSIQTWDWHDGFAADGAMIAHHSGGRTLRYFTEIGLSGKIGAASHARGTTAVHLNILHHESDGSDIGVPVHAVVRRILEQAATTDEALAIARSAHVSASSAVTVVTYESAAATAVTLEISPVGVAVVPPDLDGVLVHSNHFLDPQLALGELMPPTSDTWSRFEVLGARRDLLAADELERRIEFLDRHSADGGEVCCHPDRERAFEHRWRTLVTIDVDYLDGTLHYLPGGPCSRLTRDALSFTDLPLTA